MWCELHKAFLRIKLSNLGLTESRQHCLSCRCALGRHNPSKSTSDTQRAIALDRVDESDISLLELPEVDRLAQLSVESFKHRPRQIANVMPAKRLERQFI